MNEYEKIIAIIGAIVGFFVLIYLYYRMEKDKADTRKWIDEECIPHFIEQFDYKPIPLEDYERMIFEFYVRNDGVRFDDVKTYFDLSDDGIFHVFESIRSKIWNLRYEISQEDIVQDMPILDKINEINYQAAKILDLEIEDIVIFSHKIIDDGVLLYECKPERIYKISSFNPNDNNLDDEEWLDDFGGDLNEIE